MLPDWARIVGQMQFDSYHVFTVDEHTVEAIRVLNMLERDELAEIAPVASGLMDHLQSRRALYVAPFCTTSPRAAAAIIPRSARGSALAVGPTLGLSAEETEMVSWLVLHHLLLSQTAFKRDIDDAKTILDLADTIQSPERLRLLLILRCRHARRLGQGLERVEGDAAARALYASSRSARRRPRHHRAGRARRPSQARNVRPARRLAGRGRAEMSQASAIPATAGARPATTRATHA